MKVADLKGKKITVLGLGLHGGAVGAVRFLCRAGAQVVVTDIKSEDELKPSVEKLKDCKNVKFIFKQHRPEDFQRTDMVIKNPGASWDNKYIQMALFAGIPVEEDSSLFFKLCKNKIIGVTGTKGKTTTASLIFDILKAGGKDPVKVGVGQVSVLDKLDDLKKSSVVVFELSSWRLSALGRYGLSPDISVITNIYPDHLNYYKNMDEYIQDKKYICQNQKAGDFCILNSDNELSAKMGEGVISQVVKVSNKKPSLGRSVYLSGEEIYVNDGVDEKKIMNCSSILLRGKHNIYNVLLGIGVGYFSGVDTKDIKKAVSDFRGVSHRLEFVREIDGIKYYNDTAATMPEAAILGLKSFSEPVVLICGGADKKLEMDEFGKEIIQKAKAIVFLKGEATDKIIASMQKFLDNSQKGKEFRVVDSMEKAVELARCEADRGDVVLLSPGSTSFGLFANEFDRGDKFKSAVKALK
jgi:UDP-N-acetylmuramoylalanine--D-glutamate ligase